MDEPSWMGKPQPPSRKGAMPTWAIRNNVLIVAPIPVGAGAMFSHVWFFPEPSLRPVALVALVLYYAIVFYLCQRSAGARPWSSIREDMPGPGMVVLALLGAAMFSFFAFQAFHVALPALLTSMFSAEEVHREFTVASAESIHQSASCGTLVELVEAKSTPRAGFCVRRPSPAQDWSPGTRIMLSGKESVLGFHATRIGP